MSTFRRSLAFSFAEKYGSYALVFVGMVVLARLLTPKDFGIFAVGMAVVALIDVFRDFGVGNYLVQEQEVTEARVHAAFTVTFSISLLSGLSLLAGTDALAAFYDEPGLNRLMPLFAANFLLVPFGMPSLALLRRDMAFKALAGINLFAALVNLVVVVALAVLGFGFMSLGWATLASGVARTVVVLAVCPCFWAFRPSFREWRRLGGFGAYSTATALINVLHDWLPQLIMGRVLGFAAVGLYGRAVTVCQLPDKLVVSALHPVILPALSERARRNESLKPAYLTALSHLSAVQWPILICLALLAEPVVHLLLGDQWLEVAPLVRVMALAALSLTPAFMTYPTLVALGRIRDTLTMSLISVPPSMLLILAAAAFSLQAVAAIQLINAPLQVFVALSFIRHPIGLSWRELARNLRTSVAVALCATAAPAATVALRGGFEVSMPLPVAVRAAIGAAAGWLVGVSVSGHPLLKELRGGVRLIGRRLRLRRLA